MNTKLLQLIGATALLFGAGGMALADTVDFNPNTSTVNVGDMFSVDIVGDFTELAGGVIDLGFNDIEFNGDVLRVDSVVIDPYWDFLPDGGGPATDGGLAAGDIWPGISFDVFANNPAVGTFTIATINMTALAVGMSNLTILGTSEFFSPTSALTPTLIDGKVNVVPVPAAVWLFGSGLLGLVGIARRKTV